MSDNFHKGSIKEERQIYEYDDSANENESDSEDSREGKESEHRSKKKYSVIPQSVREKFIKRVLSKEVTIKEVMYPILFSLTSNRLLKSSDLNSPLPRPFFKPIRKKEELERKRTVKERPRSSMWSLSAISTPSIPMLPISSLSSPLMR